MTATGALAALSLCILFGSNAIAVKMSFSGLGVYFASVVRFSIAALCLALWATLTGKTLGVPKKDWFNLVVISLTFSMQLLLFYTGLSMIPASRSSIIINLQPFFVLVLAHFFISGDRITLRKAIGIVLGFAGIAFIFSDKSALAGPPGTGELIVLCGAFLWGANAVYTKRVIHRYRTVQVAFYPMVAAVPISALGSFLFDGKLVYAFDATIALSLFYQSVIVATCGYVAWNYMLKRYGAVSLHSFVFVMPVTGVILGGLVLDEPISSHLVAGLVLIVAGLLTTHIKREVEPPVTPMGRNV